MIASLLHAILAAAALNGQIVIDPYRFETAVPDLPTANLILNLRADVGVWEATSDDAEDADPVVEWRDQSGAGNHVTGTGADAPTFDADDGSGRPAVDFDGNDILKNTSFSLSSNPITFYAVCRLDSVAGSLCPVSVSDLSTLNTYYRIYSSGTSAVFRTKDNAGGTYNATSTATLGTSNVVIIHGKTNGTNSRACAVNGANEGTNTSSATFTYTLIDNVAVGCSYADSSEALNFDGPIYQILVYNEQHDASEEDDTIANLSAAWGL